jgi:hypothetical protein
LSKKWVIIIICLLGPKTFHDMHGSSHVYSLIIEKIGKADRVPQVGIGR